MRINLGLKGLVAGGVIGSVFGLVLQGLTFGMQACILTFIAAIHRTTSRSRLVVPDKSFHVC